MFGYFGEKNDIIIPGNVAEIGFRSFCDNENIRSIVIPYGVTTIWEYAFDGCKNLESIYIPDSVEEIYCGNAECDKLVVYGNTGSYAEQYAKENNIPFVVYQ